MSDPREWWIESFESWGDMFTKPEKGLRLKAGPLDISPLAQILVIEKSAYDQLLAANAELVEALKYCAIDPELLHPENNKQNIVALMALAKHGGGQ